MTRFLLLRMQELKRAIQAEKKELELKRRKESEWNKNSEEGKNWMEDVSSQVVDLTLEQSLQVLEIYSQEARNKGRQLLALH